MMGILEETPQEIGAELARQRKNFTLADRDPIDIPFQVQEQSKSILDMTVGELGVEIGRSIKAQGMEVDPEPQPQLPSMSELLLNDLEETQSTFFSDIDAGLGAAIRGNLINALKVNKHFADNPIFGVEVPLGLPIPKTPPEVLDAVIEKLKTEEELDSADRTIIGNVLKGLTEFTTNFLVARRVTGIKSPWAQALALGPVAELMTFEPDEPRISSFLQNVFESSEVPSNVATAMSEAAINFIAADPDDSNAEGIFKQALEGVVTSAGIEGIGRLVAQVFRGVKVLRAKKIANSIGNPDAVKAMPINPNEALAGTNRVHNQASQIADSLVEQVRGVKITKVRKEGVEGVPSVGEAIDIKVNSITETFEASLRKINAEADGPLNEFNIGKKVEWFRRRAKAALEKGQKFVPEGIGGERVRDVSRAAREAEDETRRKVGKGTLQKLREKVATAFVDRSANIKRALIKEGGDEGQAAVEKLVLAQGATERGALRFRNARDQIYGGLGVFSKKKRNLFDEYLQMRTLLQVSTRKPKFITAFTKDGRLANQFDYGEAIDLIRKELGPKDFADFQRRADIFFDTMRTNLDEMHASGLISADDLKRLQAFDFEPLQFVKGEIDSTFTITLPGGKTVSVSESGIDPLGRGLEKKLRTDSEFLLAQTLLRGQGRIVRNDMNMQLKRVAEQFPENPVVRVKKPKRDDGGEWNRISYREGGQEKHLYINREFSQEWMVNSHMMPKWVEMTLKSVSLSPLIRPFATGINPEFILSNLPRDLALVWFATKEFSSFAPKALAQLSTDMAQVAKDAFTRGPLYRQFVENGGAMSLLTHQGRLGDPTALSSRFQRFQHVAGYFNETSEIWVRLALMNRAIKNGKTIEEATYIARTYLDFSQGGYVTKTIDTMVPYFNAGTQALRSMARAGKGDPVVFGAKIAQAMSVYGFIHMANRSTNREGLEQVPADVRHRNMVIMTDRFFIDNDGNKRYLYYKIPIDQSLAPLKALVDATMSRFYDGKLPDEATMDLISSFGQAVPIGNLPPSVSAITAIAANYDYWRNRKVWPSDDVLPGQEVKRPVSPLTGRVTRERGERLTSAFAEDIGGLLPEELALSSPARIDTAIRSLIPRNMYTDAMGLGYEALTGQLPDQVISDSTIEMMANAPFGRRVFGITHPSGTIIEGLDKARRQAAGEQQTVEDRLDLMFNQMKRKEVSVQTVQTWINSHPPQVRQMLGTRFQNQQQIQKYTRLFAIEGLPKRDAWITLMTLPPRARVIKVVEWVENARGWENSGQQIRAIRTLWRNLPGLNTAETRKALAQEIELRGIKKEFPSGFFPGF